VELGLGRSGWLLHPGGKRSANALEHFLWQFLGGSSPWQLWIGVKLQATRLIYETPSLFQLSRPHISQPESQDDVHVETLSQLEILKEPTGASFPACNFSTITFARILHEHVPSLHSACWEPSRLAAVDQHEEGSGPAPDAVIQQAGHKEHRQGGNGPCFQLEQGAATCCNQGSPPLSALPPSSHSFLAFPCTNLRFSSQFPSSTPNCSLRRKGFFPPPTPVPNTPLSAPSQRRAVIPGYPNTWASGGVRTSPSNLQRNSRKAHTVVP